MSQFSIITARVTVGLILGYYVAAIVSSIAALFAWPQPNDERVAALAILGMFAGAGTSLFTYRGSWLMFGMMTGPTVGMLSGFISTVIPLVLFLINGVHTTRNLTVDILIGIMIGLIIGIILGAIIGFAIDYVFNIPSRYSLDTPSLGSGEKRHVPTGIVKGLILLLSFLASLGGVLIGLAYLKRPGVENQRIASQIFIVSSAGFIFSIVLTLIIS